ncbi:hypothetical protein SAMN04489761_0582 [Tenacibaculum sp. MAR_2009_124]|uniref:hypothetical protein n=1 Tax=Tenacibaculum sp. MAR_2009_124 TaxID=1250059 RepID=UPI00089A1787|nr:hypothetical protein [Tenacibaculum sp. MAR_2009_124]SEB41682.1 hypothetical protein SAMN04489761_0582 [Tenacibaculum sp. MAR_2009_124]
MKSIFNSLLIAVALFVSVGAYANDKTPKKTNALRSEIVELIGKKVPMNAKENFIVRVSFVVNNQNELVVVDVISKNKEVNSYIKNKINYKKVSSASEVKNQEIYILPIKIKK